MEYAIAVVVIGGFIGVLVYLKKHKRKNGSSGTVGGGGGGPNQS